MEEQDTNMTSPDGALTPEDLDETDNGTEAEAELGEAELADDPRADEQP